MTLQVDYGNRRVEYPYAAGCNSVKRLEQQEWCLETFKDETWHFYHHESAFYFKREKDLMLFRLRWT